ncbi:MAG TPA: metal-dependent hydrolase [Candidatus Limnocylindria bacterium]|nr:metal-dependent hydrolase [Candidatus Limnocylindria bacterium]
MEPVTHALTSLALARATQKRLPRFGTVILLVSGLAADLDYVSYFAGPGSFLRFHRAALHSLPGFAVLVTVITGIFCWMDRRFSAKKPAPPSPFIVAFMFACMGAGWHLMLDVSSVEGVQLLWPFRMNSFAWNLTTNFDLWILALLIAGLLLPALFRLVSEEIGDRGDTDGLRRGASVAVLLLCAYLGARGILHRRAVDLLHAREFHGRAPVFVGAFPRPGSPFNWRGVVYTDNTIEELNFSLAPGAQFDPDRGQTHFKPEDSPVLDAGERTATARTFLNYAWFPLASVYPLENGSRFELRDLQFAHDDTSPANIIVRVDFGDGLQIKREEFLFASSRRR